MAVPKTTETGCRDGSVETGQVIETTPSLLVDVPSNLIYSKIPRVTSSIKEDAGMGLLV